MILVVGSGLFTTISSKFGYYHIQYCVDTSSLNQLREQINGNTGGIMGVAVRWKTSSSDVNRDAAL